MAGLFDKVVVGLNRGINSVSEGSKTMIEKAQLSTQIADLEKERTRLFQNIGNLIYNLQNAGTIEIEQCKGLCEEIARINDNIDTLRVQLQNIEAKRNAAAAYNAPVNNGVKCSCGFVNKEGAKFCARCGSPVEAV